MSELRAYSTGLSISWLVSGPEELNLGRAALGLDGDALMLGVSNRETWIIPERRLNEDLNSAGPSVQTRGPAGGDGVTQAYWWVFPGPPTPSELTITARWPAMEIADSTVVPLAMGQVFAKLPRRWVDN